MRSKAKITQTQREVDALNLRIAGHNFEQIATAIGYRTRAGAYQAVERALRKTLQEPADAVRQQELARLDRMLLGIWTAATTASPHQLEALDRVLKIMDRRCYYITGLKVPDKIAPTTPDGTASWQPLADGERFIDEAYLNNVAGLLVQYGLMAGAPQVTQSDVEQAPHVNGTNGTAAPAR